VRIGEWNDDRSWDDYWPYAVIPSSSQAPIIGTTLAPERTTASTTSAKKLGLQPYLDGAGATSCVARISHPRAAAFRSMTSRTAARSF